MAISQAEFVNTVIQNGPLNPAGLFIHLESNPSGTGNSTILGLAIYPEKNQQSTDVTRVLEQVETIRFKLSDPYPTGPDKLSLTLPVLNRGIYADIQNETFFYLQTPPTTIQLELSETLETGVLVTFEPFITDLLFSSNDYNALLNSVNNQRLSSYRQVADDNKPYTFNNKDLPLPANLELLIAGTATPAQIPDSNYTKRGWIQARYEGSVTDDTEFGGIPGFLTGRSFIGSSHVLDLSTGSICTLDQENRVLQELFHTGLGTLPEVIQGFQFAVVPSTITSTQTVIDDVKVPEGAVIKNSLAIFRNSSNAEEFVRLISYNSNTRKLEVQRGVDSTPITGTLQSIIPLIRTQIFRLDQNKVIPLSNVQVWVRDSLKVLKLDKFGVAYLESTC